METKKPRIEFLKNLERNFAEAVEIKEVADELTKAGFEPYLVGGCLRDLLLNKKPKDWDITTNATPEEILRVFPDSVYENKFGTVAVKTESEDPSKKIVEVTTFRKEGKYTDKRHPDEITFAKTIEEDLSRRDFTVNAMAFEVSTHKRRAEGMVDPFDGQADLERKVIRTVGDPEERFREDALRLMRAVRLATQLDFSIEAKTTAAIKKEAKLLESIAKERIAEELGKLLMTEKATEGIHKMEELGLLKYVLPELEKGIGMEQNKHHQYNVFEHTLHVLDYAAKNNFPLHLRLACLLHDVGKPDTRAWKEDPRGERTRKGKKGDWTFYGHQDVGEEMAKGIMERLHFPRRAIDKVILLIREHMFVYDPETTTLKGVRRLLRRVGPENISDLIELRKADRSGHKEDEKAGSEKLRHLQAMIEKVRNDPISVKMLEVNGKDVMEITKIKPGPKVGQILTILLDEVLEDPKLNDKERLVSRIQKLSELQERELQDLAGKAREKASEVRKRIDEEIERRYFPKK